jgi:hypothetical protein
LENLEILDVQVFRVHIELDLGHGNVHVNAVEDLAQGGTEKAVLESIIL